ncbi:MAG: hypothetical protein ABTQ29_12245 [Siculibacillus sp.]
MDAQYAVPHTTLVHHFLSDLFRADWADVWVAGLPANPNDRAHQHLWRGGRAGDDAKDLRTDANLYYSVSVVKSGRRVSADFVKAPILVIDDVGSKVDAKDLLGVSAFGSPRWIVQTSPGNAQWVFRLKTPIEDPRVFERIMRAIAAKGLTDPGTIDVVRAMRLPAGINGKPKYGSPSPVVTAQFAPNAPDIDFADLCLALGLDPIEMAAPDSWAAPVSSSLKVGGTADLSNPDLMLKALQDLGRVIGPGREKGVVDIECPFSDEHTSREATGTAYFGGGAFKCHHGHCETRSNWDFKAKVSVLCDEQFGPAALSGLAFSCEPIDDDAIDALERRVLRSLVASASTPCGGSRRGAKAAALSLLDQMGARFAQERDGRPLLRLDGATYDISSTAHQRAVLGLVARGGVGPLSKTARGELLDEIESRALVGPIVAAHVRVAASPGRIVFDMADDKRRRIVVTPAGWSVENGATIPEFLISYAGSLPLLDPAHDGRPGDFIDRLREHVNLAPVFDPRDPMDAGRQAEAALLLFLSGALYPVGGVPGAMINGPNGAGKTSAARRLAGLVDPHAASTISAPTDPAELFLVARSRLMTVIDNASAIASAISDAACALATGGGLARRALYSNGDIANFAAKRPLIWTSIVEAIKRADLLDRTATIALAPLTARRTDAELDEAWSRDHPAILALLLDVAVKALATVDAVRKTITPADLPRMADAAVFAEAMARALGWRNGLLIETLNGARAQAAGDLLSGDPIAGRIDKLLAAKNGVWEGTASDLLAGLANYHSPAWRGGKPPAANQLSAALARMAQPAQEARGWTIRVGSKRATTRNRERLIEIIGAASREARNCVADDADL